MTSMNIHGIKSTMTVSSFDKCTQLLLLLEPTQFICRIRNVSQMGFHMEKQNKKKTKEKLYLKAFHTHNYIWLTFGQLYSEPL